jgi:hypothetical protein
LLAPEISSELELSEDQLRLLFELDQVTSDSIRMATTIVRQTKADVRKPSNAPELRISRKREEVVANADKIALEAILNGKQAKRLKQLGFSRLGPQALLDDDVAARLNLTAPQRKRLAPLGKDLIPAYQRALAAQRVRQDTPGKKTEEDEAVAVKAIKTTQDDMWQVLSQEQLKAWRKLTGSPSNGARG